MNFKLHPNLANKDFIADLPLCRILLENESSYPWIFLVPRRNNVSRMIDLTQMDQLLLLKELDIAQNVLWKLFKPDQLNVAAIGNKTPQLHVHVIGRKKNDPAWPNTVWDNPHKLPYTAQEKESIICSLQQTFYLYTAP